MGRLFWKIFLSFWLTLLLIISGVIWGTTIYLQNSDAFQVNDLRSRMMNRQAMSLAQVIRYAGPEAGKAILLSPHKHHRRRPRFFVLDSQGHELLGRQIDLTAPDIKEYASVKAPDGETFRLVSTNSLRPRPSVAALFLRPFKRSPAVYILWLAIALLFSAMVSFWLTLTITRPIKSLQRASKQLAAGDLETRVAHTMDARRDEIADLAQDFDRMAERLQTLLLHQKQLLSDVSHELRSPLARLKVALGLAQKRQFGIMPEELKRIELESNRLDDLIGQVLTLSRLESGSVYRRDDYLDVAELVESIVQDCNYEINGAQKRVLLKAENTGIIEANADLLRRALENVIRNAVHYTQADTDVTVTLETTGSSDKSLQLRICDHGSGVPDLQIDQLFEPFVRLSSARDRDSGGFGLGLAIAKRAILFHNGEISAWNRPQGGLCVQIILPVQTIGRKS